MTRDIIFNPIYNKIPRGASKEGEEVSFLLTLSNHICCDRVDFVFLNDENGESTYHQMTKISQDENFSQYECKLIFEKGIYFYHFEIVSAEQKSFIVQGDKFEAKQSQIMENPFVQVVTVDKKVNVTNGIIYQIFVDRFCSVGDVAVRTPFVKRNDWGGKIDKYSNDPVLLNSEVFGGNLEGVRSKLDYLKSLGVKYLYLSPIFLSNSCHKYDTASYLDVDPMFGGDEALKNLILDAKKHEIEIVLDGVFNHTGSDSLYFNKESRYIEIGAYNSKKSKYFKWYNFSKWPDEYDCWWGVPTLPAVDGNNDDFNDFIAGKNGVIEKWMGYGIKGFRLDVVDELDEKILNNISKAVRCGRDDSYLIGEVWEDAATKIAYGNRRKYFIDNQIDSVMNYPLKNGILSYVLSGKTDEFLENVYTLLDHYPTSALMNLMNIISTHDSMRIWTELDKASTNEDEKLKLLKIASLLQYAFPGNPTIFYGDERGVEGGNGQLCRACFPWEKEKTEQEKWYKFLGKLRKDKAFEYDKFEIIKAQDGVIVIERKTKGDKLIFVTNLSGEEFVFEIDKAKDLLHNKMVKDKIVVENMGVGILKIRGEE